MRGGGVSSSSLLLYDSPPPSSGRAVPLLISSSSSLSSASLTCWEFSSSRSVSPFTPSASSSRLIPSGASCSSCTSTLFSSSPSSCASCSSTRRRNLLSPLPCQLLRWAATCGPSLLDVKAGRTAAAALVDTYPHKHKTQASQSRGIMPSGRKSRKKHGRDKKRDNRPALLWWCTCMVAIMRNSLNDVM